MEVISQFDTIDTILYKQYTWGSGRILFHKDTLLITSWGRGNYEFINKRVVKATWCGNPHILVMNDSYDSYTSINMNSMVVGTGVLDNSLKDSIPTNNQLINYIPCIGNKNLVYFCVFHNKGYIDLLKVLLSSLKLFSKTDAMDFLVFTSNDFKPIIEELSLELQIPIAIHVFNFTTMHEAGCARLFIFEYPNINEYSKILYIDSDIIVQNDLSHLFEIPIEDKVYAIEEFDINGEGHGAWFFDFTKWSKTTPAINSGVLLFQNTRKIQQVFNDINTHISNLKKTNSVFPLCMDQSFIVYHLINNNMCDNEIMKKYIFLSGEFAGPIPVSNSDIILSHFIWPIGNSHHKMNRMITHLRNLFTNYTTLQKITNPPCINDILGKKYTWNSEILTFENNSTISVSSEKGIFTLIDTYTVKLQYLKNTYILKMNTTFDKYVGFNTETIECISGSIVPAS